MAHCCAHLLSKAKPDFRVAAVLSPAETFSDSSPRLTSGAVISSLVLDEPDGVALLVAAGGVHFFVFLLALGVAVAIHRGVNVI